LRFPDVQGIEIIHEDIMRRMGEGSGGYVYEGGVSYCVESARDFHDTMQETQSLIWKAAYYMWCITSNHPFIDGNKRTAFQTADVFLRANGYKLVGVDPIEALVMLSEVSRADIGVSELVIWVEKHLSREGELRS
jgi:death-on-curing protein